MPLSPSDFDHVVGFDLVHDPRSCPHHAASCVGTDSCLLPVRALFLGEHPLVGPIRCSPVLAASPCITANSPSLGPTGFIRRPHRHGTDSGSEASSFSTASVTSLILSRRQSDDEVDVSDGSMPGEKREEEVMGDDQRREALAKAFEETETPGGMVLFGRGTAVGFGLARGAFGLSGGHDLAVVVG